MAWGVPFDSGVVSILAHTWLFELLEEDYVGSTTTLEPGEEDGLSIDWGEQDREIDPPMLASIATAQLFDKSGALQDWLDTIEEGKARMRVSKNGSVFWEGIITPDIDEAPDDLLIEGATPVNAVDGLTLLKGQRFIETEDDFESNMTFVEAIAACLSKLPYQLNFRIASNWFDIAMANSDPMAQLGFRGAAMRDVKNLKSLNCFDVLEQLLLSIEAQIHQEDNVWYITQRELLFAAGGITWYEYDTTGAYVGTYTIDPDLAITDVHSSRHKGARRKRILPYRSATIIYDHGESPSIILNGDFQSIDPDDADVIPHWTPPAGDVYSDIITNDPSVRLRNAKVAQLPYVVASTTPDLSDVVKWLTSNTPLPATAGTQYQLSFDVRPVAGIGPGGDPLVSAEVRAFVWIKLNVGSKWLVRSGTKGNVYVWSDTEDAILLGGGNGLTADEWQTETLPIPAVVADGDPIVQLSQIVTEETGGFQHFSKVYYDNISIKPFTADGPVVSTETVAVDPTSAALEEREPTHLRLGDGPIGGVAGSLLVKSGSDWIMTSDWSRGYGGGSKGSHAELLTLSRLEAQRRRLRAIRATWHHGYTVRPKFRLLIDSARYAVGRMRLNCYRESVEGEWIELRQDSLTPDYEEYKERLDPTGGGGGGGLDQPFAVTVTYAWDYDWATRLWNLIVTWTPKDRSRSVRYSLETADAEPVDWSTESIGTKDTSQESGTFTIGSVAHGVQYYLFVKAYQGPNGDGGEDGDVVRVPLTPPDPPVGGFDDKDFVPPVACLLESEIKAFFPMASHEGGGVYNVYGPDGIFTPDAEEFSYDAENIYGLTKEIAATTDQVTLLSDFLGDTALTSFAVVTVFYRGNTNAQTFWNVLAGTNCRYYAQCQADGTIRFSVTDEASSTTNIDSTLTIGQNEFGMILQTFQYFPFIGSGITSIKSYVLNATGTWEVIPASPAGDFSLDFTQVKIFYEGIQTQRFQHWMGNRPVTTESEFLAEALCFGQYLEGVGGGEDFSQPFDSILIKTATEHEIWDLQGNEVDRWTLGGTAPGTQNCRSCHDPIRGKVFYEDAGRYIRSCDIGGANDQLEYDSGSATKLIQALWFSPGNSRVNVAMSNAGGTAENSFGYLSGNPGSMSYNELTTTPFVFDFAVHVANDSVFFHDGGDGDLDWMALNGTLLSTESQGTITGVGMGLFKTVYVGPDYVNFDLQVWSESDGDLFRKKRYELGPGISYFAPSRIVDGSDGFTAFAKKTVCVHSEDERVFFEADGHIYVADALQEDQGETDCNDLGATNDSTVRGVALMSYGFAPLTAPTLTATTSGSSSIGLSWTTVSGAVDYEWQRSLNGTSGWTTINTLAGTSDSDTGLSSGTTYYYRVRARSGAGPPGPWSNVDSDTTEAAPAVVVFAAIYSTGTYHRIYTLDFSDFSVIDYYDIDGAWNGANWGRRVAYLQALDLVLYGTDDGDLHAVYYDGGAWTGDWVAYSFGGSAPIKDISVVEETGAVWVFTTTGRMVRFDSTDINLDTTWDAPSYDPTASSTRRSVHAYYDGSNENRTMAASGAASDIYTSSPYLTTFANFNVNSGEPDGSVWWDKANSLVFYIDGGTIFKVPDSSPHTRVLVKSAAIQVAIFLYDGLLYFAKSGGVLSSIDPYTVSGETDEYDHGEGAMSGFWIGSL